MAADSLEQTFQLASQELQSGTLVLVLGAGDITGVAKRLAEAVNAMTYVSATPATGAAR